MIEQLLKDAQEQIDSITKKCPKSGEMAQKELDNFGITCDSTLDEKDDIFKGLREAIGTVRKDCPDAAKECDALEGLIVEGEALKCGGP